MTKAIDWLNENGSDLSTKVGDSAALFAHVETYHPVTEELKNFVDDHLPYASLDLEYIRLLCSDDIIEISASVDEYGFLLSLGFVVIADHDNGVVLMNATDGTVHFIDLDILDLSRIEFDEDSEEYFWDGEAIEDGGEDFEMIFDQAGAHFRSFEKFDRILTQVLKGELEPAELGVEE